MTEKIEDATDQQLETIKLGARVLFKSNQLVEVRVRLTDGHWRGMYFTNHEYMASVVKDLDGDSRIQSTYYVFNKINPKLIEQRAVCQCSKCTGGGLIVANPDINQIQRILSGPSQHLTTDEDIEYLNWLFIDVDTIRAPGFEHESSSREEKHISLTTANKILGYLGEQGWARPILADSGNGFHILPRINMPNTPSNIVLALDCLKALAAKFNCPGAEIDDSVFNPARLTRAYGSHTRKGTSTEERPFRQNRIKPPDGAIATVSLDQIIALGADAPKSDKTIRGDMPLLHPTFEPDDFFRWYEEQEAFYVTGSGEWQGHEVRIIDHCIISGTKHTGSKLTGFIIGDSFGYHCWSPECDSPNIGDVLHKLSEEGFKRYPKKIWVEEDVSNFAEDVTALEQAMEEEKQTFEAEAESVRVKSKSFITEEDTDIYSPVVTDGTSEPEPPSKSCALEHSSGTGEKLTFSVPKMCPACGCDLTKPYSERLVSRNPNELVEHMMNIIFRDPEKIYSDFVLFKQRFVKLASFFDPIISDTFEVLLRYEEEIRHLPTKIELKDYVNNHPAARDAKKKQICDYIDSLADDPSRTFDVTAIALMEEVEWLLEKRAVLRAHDALKKTRDIAAARTILRKHWASSTAIDSDFRPGAWQENTDTIYEAFRRDIAGEADDRKFKIGFDTIDNSGMNIGLDGMHALVLYGPANNRKTTTALTWALNFAMQGKHGLFLAGEHGRLKIEKALTLMFSHYLRRSDTNPDGLDVIPGLNKWEGLNKSATPQDLEELNKVLLELKTMRLVPGYLEVQNIDALVRGESDALGAIQSYVDATYRKYQWDFVVIDPLDSILPNEGGEDKNHYQSCCSIVDRLFSYSRTFAGDRGLMVVVTAQFRAEARRAIEKIQQKNTGPDSFDDEIQAQLWQDSQIQYIGNKLTQRFDLAFGVACRKKEGFDGLIVKGRSREGGIFDMLEFKVDPDSNLAVEKANVRSSVVAATEETIQHNFDESL